MRKRRFELNETMVSGIIAGILLLAGLGVYICGKNQVFPTPEPEHKAVRRQALMLVIEEEENLHKAMDTYIAGDTAFVDYLAEYSCISALRMPEDGLWAFELDATRGSAIGGRYYDLFYCETDPCSIVYDWFGSRNGTWEEAGNGRLYRHKGNEIYLEALGNYFWFGYCYC